MERFDFNKLKEECYVDDHAVDTKKLLQLVEYVYELLKLNENPEDIYPILSWMCRNGYFTNFEFKDEDIFINGKQITKDGLLIILNNE